MHNCALYDLFLYWVGYIVANRYEVECLTLNREQRVYIVYSIVYSIQYILCKYGVLHNTSAAYMSSTLCTRYQVLELCTVHV